MFEKEIEDKISRLPKDLQREALDFIDFLIYRRGLKTKKAESFKFNWEGSLSDIKDKFTSIELQHKALEWR